MNMFTATVKFIGLTTFSVGCYLTYKDATFYPPLRLSDARDSLDRLGRKHFSLSSAPATLGYPDTYHLESLSKSELAYVAAHPRRVVNLARSSVLEPIETRRSYSSREGYCCFDVVVIGAGFAGLSTALRLREHGKSVLVVEKGRVGCGASGLSAGMLRIGFPSSIGDLERRVSTGTASSLYQRTAHALVRVRDFIQTYHIDCKYREDCAAVNPLSLALGLARALEEKGGVIAERSEVVGFAPNGGSVEYPYVLKTLANGELDGMVKARHVVCCTNEVPRWFDLVSYLRSSVGYLSVMVSAPRALEGRPPREAYKDLIQEGASLLPTHGGRILYGETICRGYALSLEKATKALTQGLSGHMPELAMISGDPEFVWQGRVVMGVSRMPLVGQVDRKGLWVNAGHGGTHGMVSSCAGGLSVADAIATGDMTVVRQWESVAPWVVLPPPLKSLPHVFGL